MAKVTQSHTTLMINLCKSCGEEDFDNLKELVRSKEFGGLRAGEIEKLKSLKDLLDKLQKKRVFKPGDYRKLKQLFENAEFYDGIEDIDECEENSGAANNTATAEVVDQGDLQVNYQSKGVMSQPNPHAYSQVPTSSSGSAAMVFPRSNLTDRTDASPILEEDQPYEKGRGYCLFINNFVEGGPTIMRREGAEIDERNIRSLFQEFITSVDVETYRDVTKQRLMQILSETKTEIRRKNIYKSFMCIINSHGKRQEVGRKSNDQIAYEEGFLTVDDVLVTEEEITEQFEGEKMPELTGRPKVFIFQCCRGTERGRGVLDKADSTEMHPAVIDMSDDADVKSLTRPTNADMLIVHSTSKGTLAFRNEEIGTWFIHFFCEVLKAYHTKDHLQDMLVRVNSKVAKKESVGRDETDGRGKQMPCLVSTFTKKFMLT